ncbi:MAG: hypothetical protein RJB65_527 [Actinomycetota bacterium]
MTHRSDPRDLKSGRTIGDRNGYYDSQNIVVTGEPHSPVYSVIFHHSENREGGPGLRLLSTVSTDGGRVWSAPLAVDSPERQSHDGYQLVQRRGDGSERIILLYGWNPGSQYPEGSDPSLTPLKRTDMQLDEGYWITTSDDGGRTWSSERHLVPVRRTAIDRRNPWGGTTMGMFLCDKPQVIDGAVYSAFQKTVDGAGETPGSEVFVLRSRDLLAVDDLSTATWETLPLGEHGLTAPGGELSLGEEPHVLAVDDATPGRLFCLWRAETGRLAATYSGDGGETWDPPFWLTHEGRPLDAGGVQEMRNPRGSITPFRLRPSAPGAPSEFVMLYYNNGRTDRLGYVGRRVYWLTHGRSTPDGHIEWSQPEIALYWDGTGFEDRPEWNPDWAIVDGPGYPDFAELADGTVVFVESNKLAVRFHQIDRGLLTLLRRQHAVRVSDGLADDAWVLDTTSDGPHRSAVLTDLRSGGGFSISITLRADAAPDTDAALVHALSNVTAALGEEPTTARIHKGYVVSLTSAGQVGLRVTDGYGTGFEHTTTHAGGLCDGAEHVVTFIVDGGPKVVSVVIDERLDDGGDVAPQGWAFVPAALGEVGGAEVDVRSPIVTRLRVADRALTTTEAISLARH